ncbi:aromatic-ring-hydroxylating dioxygenase subunit beta [Mycobacterium intracellulare]|uniref:Aromatic-ring-hydroxylating dioxygenase subunit beta n=1 Tax=Mycobacterium intracellulare TaxID=1767 RepID=A0AAE4RF91_MYCIT|nr:aromatic-ring-hydroxylating dioxygenase subunit beta [Mycobacterium intracellulare]MDV6979079.1 aromatic-ring-hydroxylating dioxygenase subunit beta [Mycobacterium intracellulare]MDV6984487.1 aromatic-ring-hydroxylating dioxygenase subunit beta [Mycobacterium intracellulare]MDV7014615.1 aromatic-ring-hydroxylating dioxygenase subunit beta [Mycobacterium intracellulare]MDV7029531.1 aromatic-ring-hydroxylating dioxygenase subunit beta [Mycobacterium intracellulare]
MVATTGEELLLRYEIEAFLFNESELLDDGRFHDWLELCSEDIRYVIPVRATKERGADGISTVMTHWDDDYTGLQMRVLRLDTEYAWAEDPASRIRHFVSNVRVRSTSQADEYEVRSNLLVSRSRGDSPTVDLVVAERRDRIRRTEAGLRLAARTVVLDHSVIGTHNLAFFF